MSEALCAASALPEDEDLYHLAAECSSGGVQQDARSVAVPPPRAKSPKSLL